MVSRVRMLCNNSMMNWGWVGLFSDDSVVRWVSMVKWVSLLSDNGVVNWGWVGLFSDDSVMNWLRHDMVNWVSLVGNHCMSRWVGIYIIVLVMNSNIMVNWCCDDRIVVSGNDLVVCIRGSDLFRMSMEVSAFSDHIMRLGHGDGEVLWLVLFILIVISVVFMTVHVF